MLNLSRSNSTTDSIAGLKAIHKVYRPKDDVMTIFDTAPILETRQPRRSRTRRRDEVELEGLMNVVALRQVAEKVRELLITAEIDTKWRATQHFIADGCAKGQKPESFIGVEDIASGIVAMRVRSVNSPLTADEIAALDAEGIPYEKAVEQEETYAINPRYLGDKKLLAKMDAALRRIPGLPEDVFVKQPGKVRCVVDQEALENVFKLPPERALPLARLMSSIAITPTVDERAFPIYLKRVQKMLAPPPPKVVPLPEKKPVKLKARAGKKLGSTRVTRRDGKLRRK